MSEPVTVTVARTVAPGRDEDFAAWSDGLTAAASGFPGCLGTGLLRPTRVGEPWHVVFRFDSGEHLRRWEPSPERAAILAAGEELVRHTATPPHRHTATERVSGHETWFALPGRTAGLALRTDPTLKGRTAVPYTPCQLATPDPAVPA